MHIMPGSIELTLALASRDQAIRLHVRSVTVGGDVSSCLAYMNVSYVLGGGGGAVCRVGLHKWPVKYPTPVAMGRGNFSLTSPAVEG